MGTSTACFKSSRPQKSPNVCHPKSPSIRDIDPTTMSAISPEKEKNPEVTAQAEKKAEETKGSPGKKTAEYELKLKEAMGNLAAGKRNLLINDISGAVVLAD